MISRVAGLAVGIWLSLSTVGAAQPARMALAVVAGHNGKGPVTVFYSSDAPAAPVTRGPFIFDAAWQGAPRAGNRRLIVISHGSGGAPWPFVDLARTLVKAGFVVAVPEHAGDNYRDHRLVGPESWKRRPAEAVAAIDALEADPRLGPLLDTDRVGVYGTSAGGLTALTLAGARWSPANFMRHCLAHMREDFPGCVGLTTSLRGNVVDGVKVRLAGWVHRWRFADETRYGLSDRRIVAVVASVPMATPIDVATLATPAAAVGLIEAEQDRWLLPRFHVERIRAACARCEMLADLPTAGHGSLFSPWPDSLARNLTPLLVDPPGFDRAGLPAVYATMTAFFVRHVAERR